MLVIIGIKYQCLLAPVVTKAGVAAYQVAPIYNKQEIAALIMASKNIRLKTKHQPKNITSI